MVMAYEETPEQLSLPLEEELTLCVSIDPARIDTAMIQIHEFQDYPFPVQFYNGSTPVMKVEGEGGDFCKPRSIDIEQSIAEELIINVYGSMEVETCKENGSYKIRRYKTKFEKTTEWEEEYFEPFPGNLDKFQSWIQGVTDDDVEAMRQIYYDMWNFESGTNDDLMKYHLATEELKRRKNG